MLVRMKTNITGSRNGEPWPEIGDTLDVPDHEAADLIHNGYAEEATDDDELELEADKDSDPDATGNGDGSGDADGAAGDADADGDADGDGDGSGDADGAAGDAKPKVTPKAKATPRKGTARRGGRK